jgi:type VI secretion system protein ImpL
MREKMVSYLLGVLASFVLLWFGLPKFGLSSLAWRIVIFLLLLILIAIGVFIKKWIIERKGEKLHQQIQSQQEVSAGRQLEIAVLKEKMDEAIYALKTSELAVQYRGSAALYALPWFMVIGPSAAGKSTLLRNSHLHFPLTNEEEIRVKGYGGTRNCDWWFADEAIFLDTAGRYTTEEDDKEEWKAFLKLLKKYRPRQPINGILVVISLSDILSLDEEALKKHVKLIRERIAEITQELGFLFPVYLLLTKLDLLPGFSAFFKSLSEAEQQQVLGIYLGNSNVPSEKFNLFKNQLKIIYTKLLSLVFKHSHFESHPLNQIEIIDFPKQFEKTQEFLISFIKLLFKENPYQETPNFMGIYFTSATSKPKSYFIHDVFSKVIFPNQTSVIKSKYALLTLRWIKMAGVVTALIAVISIFLMYSTSFTANSILLHRAITLSEDTNNALMDSSLSLPEKLQSLRILSDFIAQLQSYKDNIPLHLRLGLYRGNDLYPILSNFLKQNLDKLFLKSVSESLEKQLNLYQEKWALNTDQQNQLIRGDYYTTLKVYLMLCEPEHMDPDLATNILAEVWSDQTKLPEKLLRGMVYFYITASNRLSWGEKSDLVQLSRQQLYSQTDINNLYAGLRAKGINQFGKLSIQQFLSRENKSYFTDSVLLPAFFTKDMYEAHIKLDIEKTANDAMRGDWVMGSFQNKASPEQIAQLKNQLNSLYFTDYINNWLEFLSNIHSQSFEDIESTEKALNVLSNNLGPISQLLLSANQNFDIENSPVKNYFHDFMNLPETSKNNYLKQLLGIKNLLERLSMSADIGRDAETLSTQILSGNSSQSELYQASIAANALTNNINNSKVKNALSNILLAPIRESWHLILKEATKDLQTQWQTLVLNNYQQTLSNKFPFSQTGDDADRESVSHFFNKTNGILWQFINQNLMPYLQQTSNGWETRKWLEVGVNFSPEFLIALNQVKSISEGFFSENPEEAKFTFEVYPEPTPGLREISLSINGQSYRYRNEPQEWQKMHWPGEDNNDVTSLSVITAKEESVGTLQIESLWGLFKLLKQATLTDDKNSAILASWNIKAENDQHYKVSFLIKSAQNNNLFKSLMLEHFNLPTNLFDNKGNNDVAINT